MSTFEWSTTVDFVVMFSACHHHPTTGEPLGDRYGLLSVVIDNAIGVNPDSVARAALLRSAHGTNWLYVKPVTDLSTEAREDIQSGARTLVELSDTVWIRPDRALGPTWLPSRSDQAVKAIPGGREDIGGWEVRPYGGEVPTASSDVLIEHPAAADPDQRTVLTTALELVVSMIKVIDQHTITQGTSPGGVVPELDALAHQLLAHLVKAKTS